MSKELKTQLIQQCKDTVGNDLDGRRPLNIAVIGPPGCGKSSFLNTFLQVLIIMTGPVGEKLLKRETTVNMIFRRHHVLECN
jgi:predicted GTPase